MDKKTPYNRPTDNDSVQPSRRRFLKNAGALGAVAATGFIGGAPFVHAQNKQLRLLNPEAGQESVRALREAVAAYEKQTGVSIVIDTIPPDNVYSKLQAAISSGTPYDIAGLAFIADVVVLGEAGHLVPMNDLISRYEWGPNILFPINGNNYWYPYDYNFNWLYYRKDLYKQKGLKVPRTWEEMRENAQALTTDSRFGAMHPIGSNGATQWMSLGYMWAEGVELLDSDFNLIMDNEVMKPRMVNYLDHMKALSGSMPPGMVQALFATAINQYAGGQVAHAPYAGRLMEVLDQRNPELAANTGYFMYPDESGEAVAVNHGYDGWVVVNTPMQEESLKFMNWFSENRFIDFLHSAPLHFQPARMDVYEDKRWLSHPLIRKYQPLVEFMRSILTRDDVIIRSIDTSGPRPDVRPGRMFGSYAMAEALQNRLLRDMPAAEAVDICAQEYRAILEQA